MTLFSIGFFRVNPNIFFFIYLNNFLCSYVLFVVFFVFFNPSYLFLSPFISSISHLSLLFSGIFSLSFFGIVMSFSLWFFGIVIFLFYFFYFAIFCFLFVIAFCYLKKKSFQFWIILFLVFFLFLIFISQFSFICLFFFQFFLHLCIFLLLLLSPLTSISPSFPSSFYNFVQIYLSFFCRFIFLF